MSRFKHLVVQLTVLSFLCTGVSLPSNAAVLTTQDYLAGTQRAANLQSIDATFAREDVRQQLVAMGVEPAAALERIARLPDQDVARLAAEMEDLPAGGDVLAIIGIVFVVLLILELTGVIDIFKKT